MKQQNGQSVDNDKIYNVLCEIRDKLMLLVLANSSQIQESKKRLFENNDNLKKVYNLSNGNKTVKEIAIRTKLSERAVQKLTRQLEQNGLIRIVKKGNAFLPKKI